MKKTHVLALFLVAALLIGVVAVGMAPQAKAEDLPHGGHCVCGGNVDTATAENGHTCAAVSDWQPLTAAAFDTANAKLLAGNYYLTGDFAAPATAVYVMPNTTVSICLNGHKLTLGNRISVNGVLNISDCVGGGSIYDKRTTISYATMVAYSGGTINLFGGTVYEAAPATENTYGTIILGCDDLGKAATKGIPGGMNIYGGTVKGTKHNHSGGAITVFHASCTLNLYGGTVEGGTLTASTAVGGAITMGSGIFNMKGGTVTGGTAANGGCIAVGSGTLNITGGTITGGTATAGGGDIYLSAAPGSGKIRAISNATISNGSAANGGAIYAAAAAGNMEIKDTTIIGCSSTGNGGGMLIKNNNTLTLSGNTVIKDCTSGGGGGGAFIDSTTTAVTGVATFVMKDNAKIENCSAPNGSGGNVGLNFQAILRMQDHAALIGGTAKSNGGNLNAGCYSQKDSNNNTTGYLYSQIFMTGDSKIEKGKATGEGGNVYVNVEVRLNMTDNAQIIDGSAANGGNVRMAYYSATLKGRTLMSGHATMLGGTATGKGGSLYNNGGLVSMTENAAIIGNKEHPATALNGGCIYSEQNTSDFTMGDNALVSGGTAKTGNSGGCIGIGAGGKFTMNGGTVENGTVSGVGSGGNVVLFGNSTFTMNGGTIQGGQSSAGGHGGNVFISSGTFNMNGGELTKGVSTYGNNASSNGGNLAAGSGSTLNLTAGKITDGQATNGGNIYMTADATWNVGAIEISGGKANKYDTNAGGNGGNIYQSGTAADKISFNGTTITDGTARAGGSMAVFGKMVMTDCTIDKGTAEGSGNIFIYNSGNLTLNNCTVENGTTTNGNGANIGMTNDGTQATTLVMNGGKIGTGTLSKSGVGTGIYLGFGNVILNGDVVMDSGISDIYIDAAAVINYRYQNLDVTGLDSEDTFSVMLKPYGAFAVGTDAQTKNFVAGETNAADFGCTCVDGVMYLSQKASAQIKDSKNAVVGEYYSVAEAAKHVADGQYIFMQFETIERLTADKDLYLDINGKNVRGKYDMGGNTLYGMDSSTDKYVSNTKTYFYADVENGTVASTVKAPNAKRYLNTSELRGTAPAAGKKDSSSTRRSFDRFYVGVSSVTMNPYSGEVGFKGIVGGGENVKAALAAENAFGFKVWVDGGAPETTALPQADFVTGSAGNPKNLTIKNQLEAVNEDPTLANVKVHAQVFITLADGTEIDSFEYAYSIVDMFQLVDGSFAQMDKAAQASLVRLFKQYEVMKDWSLTNIAAAA